VAGYLAILSLLTVLFVAPLILCAYVVVPRGGTRALLVWFGLLTALLVVALGAGALALFLELR
jgi:hypothetical protein